MMRRAVRLLCGVLFFCAVTARGQAQTPEELVERGLTAFTQLDFNAAAGLLRSAFAAGAAGILDPDEHAEALTMLGAAEVFRGNPNLARDAFRQLVLAFPFYEVDELVFPPEVTSLFARVKQSTPVVRLTAPPGEQVVAVGQNTYQVTVRANTNHEILAVVTRGDGRLVQTLFTGPVGDRMVLRWDGRDTTGALLRPGPYTVSVRSGLEAGAWERVAQLPLDVQVRLADTIPTPGAVPDSLLRPEIRGKRPAYEALGGGVLSGLAIVMIPSVVASGSELNGARFAVAGAVGIAGIVGYFKQRPGTPIPANVSYNQTVYAAWQDSIAVIQRLNATRQAVSELRIRAGPPTFAEIGRE